MHSTLYVDWRAKLRPLALREGGGGAPPERLLQAIWFHQRLKRDALRTMDGCEVRVLHPGFWNCEAGPDFRGAIIQFGSDTPRSGDVEVDLDSTGWRGHGHDRNRNFDGVILHVVWAAARNAPLPQPTLSIADALDAPLAELDAWLGGDAAGDWPPELRGRCCAPLRELDEAALQELLRQAAVARLQSKAAVLTARARAAGWEQALWEGLFAALGYKHNVWPFRRIAEMLPSLQPSRGENVLTWQARLFGLGGLLPAELPARTGADDYVRRLWEIWWRERDQWADSILPKGLWRLHGLRPANQPLRRLALAAHWLARSGLIERLENWICSDDPPRRKPASLLPVLHVERDEFWSWHTTLNSPRGAKPQALLGAPRAADLAINVILPWFFARVGAGHGTTSKQRAEEIFFAWPAGEDNALLKLARQRLLGSRSVRVLRSAAAQQGLLQIVRDFCEHSNALCEQCRFPDLVRRFEAT